MVGGNWLLGSRDQVFLINGVLISFLTAFSNNLSKKKKKWKKNFFFEKKKNSFALITKKEWCDLKQEKIISQSFVPNALLNVYFSSDLEC